MVGESFSALLVTLDHFISRWFKDLCPAVAAEAFARNSNAFSQTELTYNVEFSAILTICGLLRMFKTLSCSKKLSGNLKVLALNKPTGNRCSSKKAAPNYLPRIFSGIQPTGDVHLGNYLGAIQKWVELQNSNQDVIYSIVDMHSITLPQDPKALKQNILNITATLLACGIDPDKSILFQQSTVSMHTELCWILSCLTTMPRLAHLPQFKEKSATVKDVPLGLYIYPVLQAADILLYKSTHVPVGEDQLQHLQLAQHLAKLFNGKFGETFPIPHSMINDDSSCRIRSLRDPTKKMSKSDPDPKSRLQLTDEPKVLLNKVKKAITDFTSEVTFALDERPGVSNLITIHSLLSGKTHDEICREAQGLDTGRYKLVVADVVIEKLTPIRERLLELEREPQYLEEVLRKGGEKATDIACDCWHEVRDKVGLSNNVLSSASKRELGKLQSSL
ncbi:tryptophan--tRNA ligase, mitochondrial isoform X1 [Neodiprion fabricii]|uniref:tryptophan--tRNA ligase, mitochondrial isoform X1 n=2 Tax=Neodiprion fabricii TaxID=2872261 RepID=UPI001ED96CF1|nr:tryptophan--tRNA ligase, mitochondrial isoform X1 [Neodiprion fabricii]